MSKTNIQILSTAELDSSFIEDAYKQGIRIDTLSFIETLPILNIKVRNDVENISRKDYVSIFTSMNAVNAVVGLLDGYKPSWKIYCIGQATKKLVTAYFGESSVKGTSNTALGLAQLISRNGDIKEVAFFCGVQRREELPKTLKKKSIYVNEISVYETVEIKHAVDKNYQGVLFFSPSGVKSFFSNNKISPQTTLFAIGETTAAELRKHSSNEIITGTTPGKENLARKMMQYFAIRN